MVRFIARPDCLSYPGIPAKSAQVVKIAKIVT
jgi:hypothetical protein